jgi:protease II
MRMYIYHSVKKYMPYESMWRTQEMAHGHEYCDVGNVEPSPSHKRVSISVDYRCDKNTLSSYGK